MTMKKLAPEVLTKESEDTVSTVLWRSETNTDFEKFLLVYKEDKLKARVLYYHGGRHYNGLGQADYNPTGFMANQLVLFERSNGDISIVLFKNKWGLSITNKMYKSESIESSFVYKKSSNKFWVIFKNNQKTKIILPASLDNLMRAFPKHDVVVDALMKKFGWLRYLSENRELGSSITFNTVVSKKLFSLGAAFRHVYKTPYPVAKKLHDSRKSSGFRHIGAKRLAQYKRHIINIENISFEQCQNTMFWDTVRMAMILDRKVNCSWGDARLKKEHDDWSVEITEILMDANNRDLRISKIYKDFAEFSGYNILTTTRDMVREGYVKSHCVASYIGKVDSGRCAIFSIDDYTLELEDGLKSYGGQQGLYIAQLRGIRNQQAPTELRAEVDRVVEEFNAQLLKEEKSQEKEESNEPIILNQREPNYQEQDLPF